MNNTVDILLIGNDPDLSSSLLEIFSLFGLSCVHHVNGADAIADPTVNRARLIVTDYYLPDTNGVELIVRLREIQPGLPALVITGSKEAAVIEKVNALPGCRLVHKPLGIDDLEREIKACLG